MQVSLNANKILQSLILGRKKKGKTAKGGKKSTEIPQKEAERQIPLNSEYF